MLIRARPLEQNPFGNGNTVPSSEGIFGRQLQGGTPFGAGICA